MIDTSTPADSALVDPSKQTAMVPLDADERRLRNRLAARKSRSTRKSNREIMESQVKTLECVLANLMFVKEEPADADDCFLDDDESKRVREFLRRVSRLQLDKLRLVQEQTELRRLVEERQTFEALVRCMLEDAKRHEDWNWRVLRWRALTRASFEPWTPSQYDAVVRETMEYINGFAAKNDVVTTGLTVLGWRDKRRVDKSSSAVEFSLYKTTPGDAERDSASVWSLNRSHDDYAKIKIGPNCRGFCEVLQDIDEDRCIVRVVEQYPNARVILHMVMLLFRVRVGDTIFIIKRAVQAPEVRAALPDEDAVWGGHFYWSSFEVLERNAKGKCVKYRSAGQGTMRSTSEPVAQRWLTELVFIIVRLEQWCRGIKLLRDE